MRQMATLFIKDARRLWWEVAVTLGLLAWLGEQDRWRTDQSPGPIEGWLNILLPFAWSYVIAMAVLEDPLVGSRQFWITLPCRRRWLLGAKALFVAAFIHLPYFAYCAAILAARGFSPGAYLPHLLWKQVVLLAVLTLPALALAAVVENILQFMLVTIAAGGAAVAAFKGISYVVDQRGGVSLEAPALALLAVGGALVVVIQFRWRKALASRVVAVLVVAVAGIVLGGLPRETAAQIHCGLSSARATDGLRSVRLTPGRAYPPKAGRYPRRSWPYQAVFAVPMEATVEPAFDEPRLDQVALEVRGGAGPRYRMEFTEMGSLEVPEVYGQLQPEGSYTGTGHLWLRQHLEISQTVYGRLPPSGVHLRGAVLTSFVKNGSPTSVPFGFRGQISGFGLCGSNLSPIGGTLQARLRVDCESPREICNRGSVWLRHEKAHGVWVRGFRTGANVVDYPSRAWLSPLNRVTAFFGVLQGEVKADSFGLSLIPESAVAGLIMEFRPCETKGCVVSTYELNNVPLKQFEVRPQQP
jgi:hypothetical protein